MESMISCDFKREFYRSQHGDTLAERMVVSGSLFLARTGSPRSADLNTCPTQKLTNQANKTKNIPSGND